MSSQIQGQGILSYRTAMYISFCDHSTARMTLVIHKVQTKIFNLMC